MSTGTGRLTTWYAHMQTLTVDSGDLVQPGQQLGRVGALGNATGCHLHFEVHPHGGPIYADTINPTRWLARWAGRTYRRTPGTGPGGGGGGSGAVLVGVLHGSAGSRPGRADGTGGPGGTVIATANLDFTRPAAAQRASLARIAPRAGVVLLQEDRRHEPAPGKERILLDPALPVQASGAVQAAANRRGLRISDRHFPWADITLPGIGTVRIISVHMPHPRHAALYPTYAANLRTLIASSPYPWIVGGDWNRTPGQDLAGIRPRWHATSYFAHDHHPIDGFLLHPTLTRYVTGTWAIQEPTRRDGHPAVYLRLRPT